MSREVEDVVRPFHNIQVAQSHKCVSDYHRVTFEVRQNKLAIERIQPSTHFNKRIIVQVSMLSYVIFVLIASDKICGFNSSFVESRRSMNTTQAVGVVES